MGGTLTSRLLNEVVFVNVGRDFAVSLADPKCASLVCGCWTSNDGQPQLVVTDANGRMTVHNLDKVVLLGAAMKLDAAVTDQISQQKRWLAKIEKPKERRNAKSAAPLDAEDHLLD